MSDHTEANEDLDILYPPSDQSIVVVTGSVASGFKHWGPFESIKEAVEWVESKQPFIGFASVTYVNKPEDFPVR